MAASASSWSLARGRCARFEGQSRQAAVEAVRSRGEASAETAVAAAASDQSIVQLVSFTLGGEEYAFPMEQVREIPPGRATEHCPQRGGLRAWDSDGARQDPSGHRPSNLARPAHARGRHRDRVDEAARSRRALALGQDGPRAKQRRARPRNGARRGASRVGVTVYDIERETARDARRLAASRSTRCYGAGRR